MIINELVQNIFSAVKQRYEERDRKLGRILFSKPDWDRTLMAFEIFKSVKSVADIGVGQGQLLNLFSALPSVDYILAVDRCTNTKFLKPEKSNKVEMLLHDISNSFSEKTRKVDIVIAMEVIEHIDVDLVEAALGHLKFLSFSKTVFISVPYKEKHPLYHHDKPHGHKQSFDDARIVEVF